MSAAGAKMLEASLVQAAKVMEEQLDAEIEKLEKLDEDDLEALKARRMHALKKQQV
jgi:hypothetical protein